jgi:hypothetical protein
VEQGGQVRGHQAGLIRAILLREWRTPGLDEVIEKAPRVHHFFSVARAGRERRSLPIGEAHSVTPRAPLAWQQRMTPAAALTFQSTGAAFNIRGIR